MATLVIPPPATSSVADLRCCCGRPDCAALKKSCTVVEAVEKDVKTAAQLGQVCAHLPLWIARAWLGLNLPRRAEMSSRDARIPGQRRPRGRVAAHLQNIAPCYWTRQATLCHLRSFLSSCFAFLP